jgi:arginine/lysine/ornithine decarboxylase
MHMPGHKRNTRLCGAFNPYAIDITEIEGFDNLHQPEEILLSLSDRISQMYGSGYSYPLVNGSTAGILAGISAAVKKGDKILLARNSHKAVYHGVILTGTIPVYCYPQKIEGISPYGGILPEDIEKSLIDNPEIRLVVITSPTYEGVVSDIGTIAQIVHKHGAYLLVDEAHGAHFNFHKEFPVSAVRLGADLIIQSLHKTLPALTQTAVLHSNAEELNLRIGKYLAIYQSSSPSYVLMAGIDRCIQLLEEQAERLFETYVQRLEQFYQRMEKLKILKLLRQDMIGQYGIYDLDRSKLTITIQGNAITGHMLHQLLHNKYQIMFEMEAMDYVLGMTSICDTEDGFDRLAVALLEIDDGLVERAQQFISDNQNADINKSVNERWKASLPQPRIRLWPFEAWEKPVRNIDFSKSAGRVSAAFISLFPPGAPILVPGEEITEELIDYVHLVRGQGVTVTGVTGENKDKIEVVDC